MLSATGRPVCESFFARLASRPLQQPERSMDRARNPAPWPPAPRSTPPAPQAHGSMPVWPSPPVLRHLPCPVQADLTASARHGPNIKSVARRSCPSTRLDRGTIEWSSFKNAVAMIRCIREQSSSLLAHRLRRNVRNTESPLPYWIELARPVPRLVRIHPSSSRKPMIVPIRAVCICGQRSIPVSPP